MRSQRKDHRVRFSPSCLQIKVTLAAPAYRDPGQCTRCGSSVSSTVLAREMRVSSVVPWAALGYSTVSVGQIDWLSISISGSQSTIQSCQVHLIELAQLCWNVDVLVRMCSICDCGGSSLKWSAVSAGRRGKFSPPRAFRIHSLSCRCDCAFRQWRRVVSNRSTYTVR